MKEQNKSAEQRALGEQIDSILGKDEAKSVLQDLALVIAKHDLVQKPEICDLLFRYMVFVTKGWTNQLTS